MWWTALAGCFLFPGDDLPPRDCPRRDLFYADPDGDGVGDRRDVAVACEAPDGYVATPAPTGDTGTPAEHTGTPAEHTGAAVHTGADTGP